MAKILWGDINIYYTAFVDGVIWIYVFLIFTRFKNFQISLLHIFQTPSPYWGLWLLVCHTSWYQPAYHNFHCLHLRSHINVVLFPVWAYVPQQDDSSEILFYFLYYFASNLTPALSVCRIQQISEVESVHVSKPLKLAIVSIHL